MTNNERLLKFVKQQIALTKTKINRATDEFYYEHSEEHIDKYIKFKLDIVKLEGQLNAYLDMKKLINDEIMFVDNNKGSGI